MGKFLKSRWWVGVFDAFGSTAGGAFDLLNNQHSQEFDPNFSTKSNARHFDQGKHALVGFGISKYKMQTTDRYKPLFSPCNQNETKIVPLTVF